MTRQAIIRRRVYDTGRGRAATHRRSAVAVSDAPHFRFRDPPLRDEAIDPSASRWWRATRMGPRLNSIAK
jgi:hypothetical protein